MRYKQKRTYRWSPAMAYATGLIASDGCLQSDGRHIDLTSTDIDQLQNFSRAIDRDLPISEKSNTSTRTAYRVQFSDVSLYDFLTKAGLTPAKSLTIGRLEIPTEYYSHFLRGVFDGDGTTYAYNDPRWPSSFLYYISFTGASLPFLQYLCSTNSILFSTWGRSIVTGNRAFRLQYAKRDSYLLYHAMYQESGDLYLPRKRTKLELFINQDKNDTILQSLGASGVIR